MKIQSNIFRGILSLALLQWSTFCRAEEAVTATPLDTSKEIEIPKTEELQSEVQTQQIATRDATKPKERPVVADSSTNTESSPAVDLGTGGRIALEDKGFSIAPPQGWAIRRDLPRTSLFLQAITKAEGDYPRNIAVVKFIGPKLINEVSADEFSKYLVRNFPSSSPEIAEYQLRNHQPVQMADGREGILFYTDFKVHDKAMMQAHILVSSETHHYLVTFTDLAEHFENPSGGTEFLAEAWGAMTSIELNSPNPKPLEGVQNWALYGAIIAIFVVAIAFWRHRVAGRMYRDYGEMEPGEALESDPKTKALEDDSTFSSIEGLTGGQDAKVFSFRGKPESNIKSTNVSEFGTKVDDDDDIPRDQWKVS